MRCLIAALLLAACTPAAPPTRAPEADAPVDIEADSIRLSEPFAEDRAALAGALAPGAWSAASYEGVVSACFGAAQSECVVRIVCERPTGIVTVHYAKELSPDQWTSFRIITATHVLDLPGRSSNDGEPEIATRLADGTFERQILIDHLTPAQERFAIDIWHQAQVFPWHENIAQTLEACR